MNPIEQLRDSLSRDLPGLQFELDAPLNPNGPWFLDVELDGHGVTVEWRARQGFGLSATSTDGYGEGPEEVHTDIEDARMRLVALLQGKQRTRPPPAVMLRHLREEVAGLTQEELASRLGVQQAAVSKMERRGDMAMSTLRRAVEAMGGQLEILARFPDEVVRISQFDGDQGQVEPAGG